MKEHDLIALLQSMDDEKFARTFYLAAESRNVRRACKPEDFWHEIWLLARATYVGDAEAEILVVGLPKSVEFVGSGRFHVEGKCLRCGVLLVCSAKVASCPVCGSEVECT